MATTAPRRDVLPRSAVIAMGASLVALVLGVGAFRLMPAAPLPDRGPPVTARELRFTDQPDGSILVLDATSGARLASIAFGEENFIRGTLRGFTRERRREDVAREIPFRLARWADGALTLEDPATGRRADLRAFGPTNTEAFARFLSTSENAR